MIANGDAKVWMNDNHDLVVSVPHGYRDHEREQVIRSALVEAIRNRFPAGTEDPEMLGLFMHNAWDHVLIGIEDAVEGHQYGVVLRHVDVPEPAQ